MKLNFLMCKHPCTSFKMSMKQPLSTFLPAPIFSPTPLVTKPRPGSSIVTQQAVYLIREQNILVCFPRLLLSLNLLQECSIKQTQAIQIFFYFPFVYAFSGPTIIIKLFQNFPFKNSFSPTISFMLLHHPQSSISFLQNSQ